MKISVTLVFVAMILMSLVAKAQSSDTPRSDLPVTVGTELDAVPFLNEGYYFSLIGGYDHWRLRAIVTQTNLPKFVYDSSSFTQSSLHVYAVVVDYFLESDNRGFWVGVGGERWKGSVGGRVAGTTGSFQETVATLGVGYNWFFFRNFYLDPWVAVHVRCAGDSDAKVGDQTYEMNVVQAEGSLKVGWYF